MTSPFRLTPYAFIAVLIFAFATSCNNGNSDKTLAAVTPDSVSSTTSGNNGSVAPALLDSSRLYILSASKAAFSSLNTKRKTVLVYKADSIGVFTMAGWTASDTANGNTFDTLAPPNLVLARRTATVAYPLGTYFVNVILHKKDVKKIIAAMSTADNGVIFIPQIERNKIVYKIMVGDTLSTTSDKLILLKFVLTANPSPPHAYTD